MIRHLWINSKYNPIFDIAVSTDKTGMLEYWSGQMNEYQFPKNVDFATNMDTDLYEFAKVVIVLYFSLASMNINIC